ncbi:cell division protein ZapE [Micrococcales bacterium 31B]|nr:cell division protein ZapE [Micrococcales bacterium 31B]
MTGSLSAASRADASAQPAASLALPSLCSRDPRPTPERLLQDLVPPPHFEHARLDTYIPAPDQPSQAEAVAKMRAFTQRWESTGASGGFFGLFKKKKVAANLPGVYLDGGFGVGKTHLLASVWHSAPGQKAFGTFVEYTNLAGALGFHQAVKALSQCSLVCIDEFELDDPGDTVLMSRMLRELAAQGVALAATSNTLPDALGEGRFAAADFMREIQGLASQFESIRVDGEDYRHRGLAKAGEPVAADEVRARAEAAGPGAVYDDFGALSKHLATVHPSRYGMLLDDVSAVYWQNLETITNQNVALRFVVLIDRLYDMDIPVVASGVRADQIFTEEMLRGGYRKKYRRAISRLTALARVAAEQAQSAA